MNEPLGDRGDTNISGASFEVINAICDRFEDAWLDSDTAPDLSAFLEDGPPTDRCSLFRHLIELELYYRHRAGSNPELSEYLARYPEFEAVLHDVFDPDRTEIRTHKVPQDPDQTVALGQSERAPSSHLLPQIPGYEILSELGRGGMGVVYKARHLELNRIVALKTISALDPGIRLRFRIEAEAIARLQHPHIVQIFDVGEEAHGTPYLALEFLNGGNLAHSLDGTARQIEPTVRFLEELAETIDHAHKRQIIHRDLKPANILIESSELGFEKDPLRFKVTDFGLAKQLDGQANATGEGELLGTPAYMATEQVRGHLADMGPWTDVYAIGVIGYQLLTGRPPFEAGSIIETVRQVLDNEPVPLRQRNPNCPRDLETIILKCLEKDPYRRYATAAELAQDLRRFREHRPILARPAGTWESLGKWGRRNPSRAALVGVAAMALVGMVLGVFVHLQQLRVARTRAEENASRAEQNAALAVQAVNEMLTEVAVEQLAYEPRMEKKRRALLDKARVLYQSMLRDRPNDSAVRRQLALGFRHLGDVTRQLGDLEEAESHYTQAIDRLSELHAEAPDPDLLFHLSEAHTFLGEVHRLSGRPNKARESYARAIELQQRLTAEQPEAPKHRLHLGRSHDNLALAYMAEKNFDRAQKESIEAVNLLRALSESDSRPAHRQLLARARLNQGSILRQAGKPEQSEAAFREASLLLEKLSEEHPLVPDYRHEHGASLVNLGNLLAEISHRRPEAKEVQQRSAELFRTLTREYPSIPDYRRELANSLNGLGVTLIRDEDSSEALKMWGEAVEILRQLATESPEVADYRSRLGTTLGNVARLHLLQGEYAVARVQFEEAISLVTAFLQVNPQEPAYLSAWRSQHLGLADALMCLSEDEAAIRIAQGLPKSIPDEEQGRHLALCFLARCVEVREPLITSPDPEQVLAPFLDTGRELYARVREDPMAEATLQADPTFASLAKKL